VQASEAHAKLAKHNDMNHKTSSFPGKVGCDGEGGALIG